MNFSAFLWTFLLVPCLSMPSTLFSEKFHQLEVQINLLEELASQCDASEACVSEWLSRSDSLMEKLFEKSVLLTVRERPICSRTIERTKSLIWAFFKYQFETNMTDETEAELNEFYPISNMFSKSFKNRASEFVKASQNLSESSTRMLFLASMGVNNKDQKDLEELSKYLNELRSIYAGASVSVEPNEEPLLLEPGLTTLIRDSRNYTLLKRAWVGWHRESGARMRHIYTNTVRLQNKAARESGYSDLSESWIEEFEDNELESVMDSLLDELRPLYEQVHAYARRRLEAIYGREYPTHHKKTLIPAHLLGNMWAQDWSNIFDLLVPYPNAASTNLTDLLVKNNYTVTQMFKEAEKFFTSLGFFNMTDEFWAHSMIEKPNTAIQVDCHGSAFDFFNGRDFRIKMCSQIDENYFRTVHHEMGHIEYFMAYKHQPVIFRSGANSGFHEAIGDTITLSVLTDTHLQNIGFIKQVSSSPARFEEEQINFLMKIALKKLVSLPYTYLVDKWRWDVFRGRINESNYNAEWWRLIEKYQGLEPPVKRSEKDFDPGAKYHIPNYTPYARYFMSNVLQFQFFKALCSHSGHTGPLHLCDFYGSKTAGYHLRRMLELGSSQHWRDALEVLTGERTVKSDAIKEYFQPLYEWLSQENAKYELKPGF